MKFILTFAAVVAITHCAIPAVQAGAGVSIFLRSDIGINGENFGFDTLRVAYDAGTGQCNIVFDGGDGRVTFGLPDLRRHRLLRKGGRGNDTLCGGSADCCNKAAIGKWFYVTDPSDTTLLKFFLELDNETSWEDAAKDATNALFDGGGNAASILKLGPVG